MNLIEYFDYKTVAQKKGLTTEQIEQLEKEIKEEFPTDQMMFELHILRAINSTVNLEKF